MYTFLYGILVFRKQIIDLINSLFRYDCSLREYLTTQDVPERYRTLLFAQLLEGVAHMYRNGISHR